MKKLVSIFIGTILTIAILLSSLIGGICGSDQESIDPGNDTLSTEVLNYGPTIILYAKEYEMNDYVNLIQAVMMQESGGRGMDPMQSSEGPFNKKYPKVHNGITDPNYSIECGIQELKSCLNAAKVRSASDLERISLALQGYNFGNGYISWAVKNYGGYSKSNAHTFSNMYKAKLNVKVYGDPNYVPHVMRYYSVFGETDISKLTEVSQKILAIAKSKLNCPYHWGKSGPDQFDCSGLVYYCLSHAGVKGSRSTASGYSKQFKTIPYSSLQPGDLITISYDGKTVSHIGIYAGEGKMIHASGEGSTCLGNHVERGHVVKYGNVSKGSFFFKHIYNCKRVE
jgi:Cell wall-associated hydrolases (invasion-associated proteins)